MKNQSENTPKKLLRIGCLSACLATAWTSTNNVYGQGGSNPPIPVPEPSTIVLVSSGIVAAALLSKKKLRK